ncbi:hypothetical protein ARMSODRAFT_977248 [Armillaria solidipes]|uniref:Uncharacterized protein n=1 Tax=Armillaria solidipes TaxID=1076256 RepID=A0A2H3BCP1_9AGAR|nr:hypothetical protein ARMSODRAFT_977248 [Armillaria solidipes]
MFLRTVSVAMLVAIAIANTTVRRSEVTALQDAFNNMTQTLLAIQVDYKAFSANIDIDYATAVTDAVRTLDLQVQDAFNAVPNTKQDHVMSDTDGKWACDLYTKGLDTDFAFGEDFISLKHNFQTVNFTSAVCHVFQNLVANSAPFDGKFMAAIPAKYKACIERYYHIAGKELDKVVETYCSEA